MERRTSRQNGADETGLVAEAEVPAGVESGVAGDGGRMPAVAQAADPVAEVAAVVDLAAAAAAAPVPAVVRTTTSDTG